MRFLILLLTTLVFLSAPQSLRAETLDENGIRLQTMFQTLIDRQKETLSGEDGLMQYKGDLQVEQGAGYYAVTLPHMSMAYPSGHIFDIGMVAVNAAPHEDGESWKMTIALPTPMQFLNPQGEAVTRLNIGGQRTSGIWNEKLGYFSKLDSKFENLNIASEANDFETTIPDIHVIYDLKQNAEALWSGPVRFDLKGLNLDADGVEDALNIGAVGLNLEIFDYDPAAMMEYQSKLVELIAAQQAAENAADAALETDALSEESEASSIATPAGPSPEDFTALFDLFLKALGNGFAAQYEIQDFAIKGDVEKPFEAIRIADMGFGLDVKGFKDNAVTIDTRLGYNGMQIEPYPAEWPKLAPTDLNLDISFANLPFNELRAMGTNAAEQATQNPQMAQMAGMTTLMQLPQLLSQAGSMLVLKNNYFGNDMYKITIDGTAKANPQSPMMGIADVTASIRGFDTILQSVQEQIQAGAANAANLQSIIAGLMMLKGFAEAKATDDGQIEHVLRVKMTEAGQLLINDQDISAMMGMSGAGAASGNAPQQAAPENASAPETAPAPPSE